ncbi:MAG: 6-bladed beta-propeller [Tannerella sp.]|jgi:hypothetical protein|nr:6-bladed beta-propeller [Tannerella sp.]
MTKFLSIIFVTAVYVQCSHPVSHPAAEANENKKAGEHISVTHDQAEELTVKLSDLTDSIEYVPLETTENSLIKYVDRLTVMKQHILVNDGCSYLLFSRQGKFICRVGSRGNGPGEFICGNCYDIDEENERIYVWGIYEKRLYVYDFSGKFLENIYLKNISGINTFFFLDRQHILAVKDRPMFGTDTLCLANPATGDVRKYPGSIQSIDRRNQCAYTRSAASDGKSDSIFRVTKDSRSLQHVISQEKPEGKDFFMAQLPLKAGNRYCILGNCRQEPYKYDAEWNHTTKSGRTVHYTQTKACPKQPSVYDVPEGKFCILERDGDIQGIPNDIDGGLPFIPRSDYLGGVFPEISAENQMVTFYSPEELTEYWQKKKLLNPEVKDKPVRQRFETMVSRLKDDDNIVVMIIKLKDSAE